MAPMRVHHSKSSRCNPASHTCQRGCHHHLKTFVTVIPHPLRYPPSRPPRFDNGSTATATILTPLSRWIDQGLIAEVTDIPGLQVAPIIPMYFQLCKPILLNILYRSSFMIFSVSLGPLFLPASYQASRAPILTTTSLTSVSDAWEAAGLPDDCRAMVHGRRCQRA
jgi:hypothetical protein